MITAWCTPHILASAEGSWIISLAQEEVQWGSVPRKLLIKPNYACLHLHTKKPLITSNSIWKQVIDVHVSFMMRERGEILPL